MQVNKEIRTEIKETELITLYHVHFYVEIQRENMSAKTKKEANYDS
jgi:hypothetical protein